MQCECCMPWRARVLSTCNRHERSSHQDTVRASGHNDGTACSLAVPGVLQRGAKARMSMCAHHAHRAAEVALGAWPPRSTRRDNR